MKKVIHSICILSMLALTIVGCAEEGIPVPAPEATTTPSTASEALPSKELSPEEDTTSPEPEPITILGPTPKAGLGTLQILATDPPEPDYTSIEVNIHSIKVHKVLPGETAEWIDIPLDVTSFDLLSLIGVTETLGSVETEAGKFTQIRIVVESVTVNGEPATVPSGVIRIVRPFKVGNGLTTTLELDFDGQNSVVTTGRGRYIFKPVIHLRTEISGPAEMAEIGEDTTPPEITITGVTEGQVIVSPDAVIPEFSATDDTDPDPTVVASLNEAAFTSGTVVSEVGEYELVVTAIDASDNEAEVAINFEVVEVEDTTPPEITITGVTEGQVIVSPDAVIPEFSATDDTDPDPSVVATLNEEAFTSGTVVSEVGEYELVVTATDASDNEAEIAINFEIVEVEDTTPPEITITGVTEGQLIVSPDTITPEFSATDDTDPDPSVVATLNEEAFTSGTVVSEVGEYELVVTAIDASDNEAEEEINFVIVEESS